MTWLTGAEQERVVLALLDGGPMLGMGLLESSGGMLSRGSMYVLLDRMEDAGKVVSWRVSISGMRCYALPKDGGDDGQA